MIYRVSLLIILMLMMPLSAFAGASNNQEPKPESKKEIKQIEQAQSLDQKMGIQQLTPPKPVKKQKNPDTVATQFQPRSGFQQQPLATTRDRS